MNNATRRPAPLLLGLALLLAIGSPAAADVIIVDPAGSGQPALQAAIDGADDGDILLLQDGDYLLNGTPTGVLVDGKGLTLIGDGLLRPRLRRLEIANLPAGSLVVVRDLELREVNGTVPVNETEGVGLAITSCAGGVWVEDCTVFGAKAADGLFGFKGSAAVDVTNSDSVVLTRSTMSGGRGANEIVGQVFGSVATRGGPGLRVTSSKVQARDGTLLGGQGGNHDFADCDGLGAGGGNGVEALLSDVVIAGGMVTGGAGGIHGPCNNPDSFPAGGAGVLVIDASSSLWTLDAAFAGGAGSQPSGETGLDVDSPGTAWLPFGTTSRSMTLSSPLREGDLGVFSVSAKAGDVAGYFWSFSPDWAPLFNNRGTFLLAPPLQGMFFLGVLANDQLFVPVTAPQMPAGIDGLTFLMQLFALDPQTDEIIAGGGATFVLIDDSF